MKKVIAVITIVCFSTGGFAQTYGNDYYNRFNEITACIDKMDLYNAIIKMDAFLYRYPNVAGMYFNRGLVELNMNDLNAAKKDFLKAQYLGFNQRDEFIKYYTSKSYLVNRLTEHYLDNNELDEANGFKPVFGLKDSLQGASATRKDLLRCLLLQPYFKNFSKEKKH